MNDAKEKPMTLVQRQCDYCGKVYMPKRSTSRFDSANCRKYFNENKGNIKVEAKELIDAGVNLGLPPLHEVDRTKPFTEEQMVLVRKLPCSLWLAYMSRPESASWPQEMIEQHYQAANFPVLTYVEAGPQSRRWGA